MKKSLLIVCLLLMVMNLGGCGPRVYRTYEDAVKAIDNDYFKTKVIYDGIDGSTIIQNEITGEYFLMITYPYGVDLTPIQISEMVVDPSGSTMEGEDNTNSKSESMSVEP